MYKVTHLPLWLYAMTGRVTVAEMHSFYCKGNLGSLALLLVQTAMVPLVWFALWV
jgi:hypothetical protein